MPIRRSWRQTDATEILNLDLPIVLGPFGGASSVELTALVSNRGGLGSFGLYGYSPDEILATAEQLRTATSKPYALNLWLPLGDSDAIHPSGEQFDAYLAPLLPYFEELGLPIPQRPDRYLPLFDDQVDAVLQCTPPIISFVYGVPPADILARARKLDIVTIGTATTVAEAVALDCAGLDVIVASGAEAGGHRASFLRPAEDSLIGTFALVPQVADAVAVPVVAAGGIADGRGLRAALALGAGAAQIGSAFLATEQSGAPEGHRRALHSPAARLTVLTRTVTGRLARGLPGRLGSELCERTIAPFPVQSWLTAGLRGYANEHGFTDLMALWAGQAAPLITRDDATTFINELVGS